MKDEKMKMSNMSKAKLIATTAAIFLIATMVISIFPMTEAQSAGYVVVNYHTYVYATSSPTVVGVGQSLGLVIWTNQIPPDIGEQGGLIPAGFSSSGEYLGRAGWDAGWLSWTVTRPDGTNDTIQGSRSDPVGGTYALYTPTEVGTYTVVGYFTGGWKNSTNPTASSEAGYPNLYAQHYTAAVSTPWNFTVQESAIPTWSETPLPNAYWERPVNTANRFWNVLLSDWFNVGVSGVGGNQVENIPGQYGGTTSMLDLGYGPQSAHILWSTPYYAGGLMNMQYGNTGYFTCGYSGVGLTSAIILNGRLITPIPWSQTPFNQGWQAFNLYTGEVEYSTNNTDGSNPKPDFGQIYDYESPNQNGGMAQLWRTFPLTSVPETIISPNVIETANMSIIQISATPNTINRTKTPTALGTVWQMIDGTTYQPITFIANVTQTETRTGQTGTITTGATGTPVYGLDGSILRYNVVNLGSTASPQYYLQVWNTSAGTMTASNFGTSYWQYRPQGGAFGSGWLGTATTNVVHNGANFFSLNVSIPDLRVINSVVNQTASIQCVRQDKYVVLGTAGQNDERGNVQAFVEAISLDPHNNPGSVLWKYNYNAPQGSQADNVTWALTGIYPESNIAMFSNTVTLTRAAVDFTTGTQLWKSAPEDPYQQYGFGQNYYVPNGVSAQSIGGGQSTFSANMANGLFLSYGYGGHIYAYNITTGQLAWTFVAKSEGGESLYGGTYPTGIAAISAQNNLIYTTASEHSPTQPLWRGHNLRCINATNGQEVWSILYWGSQMSPLTSMMFAADNELVGLNYFDMSLYAFGKGPSATTVSAPQAGANINQALTITGTVTDQSQSGRRSEAGDLQFSLKGTPAISDASMSDWMEYMFMQQAMPTNATGVPVTLDAIDPNGNYVHLGDTVSDSSGNYGLSYTPTIPGAYHIIAKFQGTDSYYGSSAQGYMSVNDLTATPAATAAPVNLPPTEMYFAISTIAIIIAVVIIGVLVIISLRKRP